MPLRRASWKSLMRLAVCVFDASRLILDAWTVRSGAGLLPRQVPECDPYFQGYPPGATTTDMASQPLPTCAGTKVVQTQNDLDSLVSCFTFTGYIDIPSNALKKVVLPPNLRVITGSLTSTGSSADSIEAQGLTNFGTISFPTTRVYRWQSHAVRI